jgi:hypothetical protein
MLTKEKAQHLILLQTPHGIAPASRLLTRRGPNPCFMPELVPKSRKERQLLAKRFVRLVIAKPSLQ